MPVSIMQQLLFPHLALTSLCLPVHGRLLRCLTVSLSFSLTAGRGTRQLLAPECGWQAAAASLEAGAIVDMGMPKPGAEWLMAGCACAAQPVEGLLVEVTVGSLQRRFAVCGDRDDDGLSLPKPRPFQSLPLDWAHAYGGPGCADNPGGKGACVRNGVRSLPNVCEAGIGGEVLAHAPACPGPILPLNRSYKGLGTFDARWLRTAWPGPPEDFDWSFYHLAQPGQRQARDFSGLETIRITGMHPTLPLLDSGLPGLRLRVFADYGTADAPSWHELAVSADTLWLFPNQATGMQLWHATTPTRDERSTDICQVAVCYEDADGPEHSLPELLALLRATEAKEEEVADTDTAEPDPAPAPAPGLPQEPVAVPPLQPRVPASPGLPKAPPKSPQERIRETAQKAREDIPELLGVINPMLVRQGLPPVRAADVEARIARQEQAMLTVLEQTEKAPAPREQLVQAGLSSEQVDKLFEAASLTPPRRSQFASPKAYDTAMEAFGDRFAELTGASAAQRADLVSGMKRLDPSPEAIAALKALQKNPPSPAEILRKAGLNVDSALLDKGLASFNALNRNSGDAAMIAAMQDLGLALNLDPSITASVLTGMLARIRTLGYALPETRNRLQDLARLWPDQAGAFAALEKRLARLSLDQSPDHFLERSFDLRSLAMESGISDKRLLDSIEALDPLPASPAPQPAGPEAPKAGDSAPFPNDPANAPALHENTLPGDPAASRPADHPGNRQGARPDGPPQDGPVSGSAPETVPETVPEDGPGSARDGAGVQPSADGTGAGPALLDCDGQDLSGAVLAGLCLKGARFTSARLCGADLRHADLSGASLAFADLSGACLAGADLTDADLTGATLHDCDLREARACGATFDKAHVRNCRLDGLAAHGATFTETRAAGQDFSGCADLSACHFLHAELERARFSRAPLSRATFEACRLKGADFAGCPMQDARLYLCLLDEACLVQADLSRSSWLSCEGSHLVLREAILTEASLETCRLVQSDLSCLSARGCRFLSCDLHGCDLRFCDLLQGALRDCKLGSADLRGASLFAADLLYMAVNEATRMDDCNLGRTCLRLGEE